MSQVTITLNGRSTTVDRTIAESQIVKAEAAIAQLQSRMAARNAAHRAKPITSDHEQREADSRTAADIAKYAGLVAACRAALEG